MIENKHFFSARTLPHGPKTSFFFEEAPLLVTIKVVLLLARAASLHLLKSQVLAAPFLRGLWTFCSDELVLLQPHLHAASAQQEQQGNFFALTGMAVWINMLITVIMPMTVFISVRMCFTG
jgi:hypothetical protein